MNLNDARLLHAGDYVTHPATFIPNAPIRITEVWVNDKGTIVCVRLASIDSHAWLDALGYNLPPEGKKWCRACMKWHTSAEHKERHNYTSTAAPARPASPPPPPED